MIIAKQKYQDYHDYCFDSIYSKLPIKYQIIYKVCKLIMVSDNNPDVRQLLVLAITDVVKNG